MRKLTRIDKNQIRESLRRPYDSFISLPDSFLDTVTHKLSSRPKNFTTLSINEIESLVLSNFSQNEPLLSGLSNECLGSLSSAIRGQYYGNNILDLDEGGLRLTVPTFVEIMNEFVFNIRAKELKNLKNEVDKEFYNKYFWCFELQGIEIVRHLNKAS